MKKLALVILLATSSFIMNAQNFSLSYAGGVIPDGGNITFNTDVNTPITTGVYIYVHNISAAPLSVQCLKEIVDTIPGSENKFCWGSCFGPEVYQPTNQILIANGDSTDNTAFSGEYFPNGNVGDSHIRYIFYEHGNRQNQISVVVTYHAIPASVNNFNKSVNNLSNYPNPASDYTIIDYSTASAQTTQLVVKNLLGAVIYSTDLNSSNGKVYINTSDFIDGVYFYSVLSNNTPISTKKLIVRH
jgi:hypothetical protein